MATEPKGVLVALNAGAPRYPPEEVRAALEAAAAERGIPCRFVTLPKGPISPLLDREIGGMAGHGLSRVVAAGGDGTIGAVAGAIARHASRNGSLTMGIVASGTANVLAGELGIPSTLAEAAAVAIGSDRTIQVDAIEVAGRHVLTQVGIGPDAKMIRDTSRSQQIKLGRLAYVFTFLQRVLHPSSKRFFVTIDGDRVPAAAWQIVAANAGTLGMPPFTWGPRIDPTDGIIDVCIYDIRRFRDILALFFRVVSGRHHRGGSTRFLRAREEVVIESDVPMLVQGDGEILGRTPVTLRLISKAVSVVVARAPEPAGKDTPPAAGVGEASDTAAPAAPSVREEVEAMMSQQSQTWVLQGPLRHPAAAFGALDAALFLRVNGLLLGTFADRVLTATSRVMHYGEGWGLVVLAMVVADPRSGLLAAIEILPVLWMTMLTVNYPLKRFFRRRRPFLAFVKARVLGPRPKDFSFPSGHSAAAFAGALLLTTHLPALSPLFYAIALIVALSRIYLGVHYPSDVVLGAAAGTMLATAYRALLHAITPL